MEQQNDENKSCWYKKKEERKGSRYDRVGIGEEDGTRRF